VKKEYDCWLGPLDLEWKHPPQPFNPEFDPFWKEKEAKVTAMVELREPYASREDRAAARKAAHEKLV
jgi:hypothetical protein